VVWEVGGEGGKPFNRNIDVKCEKIGCFIYCIKIHYFDGLTGANVARSINSHVSWVGDEGFISSFCL